MDRLQLASRREAVVRNARAPTRNGMIENEFATVVETYEPEHQLALLNGDGPHHALTGVQDAVVRVHPRLGER